MTSNWATGKMWGRTMSDTPDSELIRMAIDLCYEHGKAWLGDKAMKALHGYEKRIAEMETENYQLATGACVVEGALQGDERGNLCCKLEDENAELREVALALREWIDAVPRDTVLPVMPGVNRDWVDEVLWVPMRQRVGQESEDE